MKEFKKKIMIIFNISTPLYYLSREKEYSKLCYVKHSNSKYFLFELHNDFLTHCDKKGRSNRGKGVNQSKYGMQFSSYKEILEVTTYK